MRVIVVNGTLSSKEKDTYTERVLSLHPEVEIDELELDAGDEEIRYTAVVHKSLLTKQGGTVIGNPLTWNDAKRAEYMETIPNSVDSAWLC